jgi:hypothetical protein
VLQLAAFVPIQKHVAANKREAPALILPTLLCYCAIASASPPQPAQTAARPPTETRTVRVFDLRTLSEPLTLVLRCTRLLPGAAGQVEIERGRVGLKVHLRADNLPRPSQLGPECLAYVLWAVTSEGRASNLGEIQLNGSEGRLSTKMVPSRFGLIVTAEPYFAVSRPSNTVVFEAALAPDSTAAVAVFRATCELLNATLGAQSNESGQRPAGDPGRLLVLEEARWAIAVAQKAGARQFAPETLATAEHLLKLAEDQQAHGATSKDVIDTGSEAVLIAEDARVLALKRQQRAPRSASEDGP